MLEGEGYSQRPISLRFLIVLISDFEVDYFRFLEGDRALGRVDVPIAALMILCDLIGREIVDFLVDQESLLLLNFFNFIHF